MIKRLILFYNFILLISVTLLSSCSSEDDNYPSVSGNTDPASIEASNLKAYFPLESKTYIVTKGGGIDTSSTNDSATFVAGARGYAFHGKGTTHSYIKIPVLSTAFLRNLQEFTLSCWIKLPPLNNSNSNIFLVNGGDSIKGTLSLSVDSQYLTGFIYNSLTDSSYSVSISRDNIVSDEWTHIVLSYSVTTSMFALFTNGSLKNEIVCNDSTAVPMDTLTLSSSMTHIYIGAWPKQVKGTATSDMTYFYGYLDELRIWNKCLTTDEVKALYNAELVMTQVQ